MNTELVLANMYSQKSLKKSDTNQMITSDNNYRILLKREESSFFQESTNKYRCYICIIDNITDNVILELVCSESEIGILLDNYQMYSSYSYSEILCPSFSPYNSNGSFYSIKFSGPGIVSTNKGDIIEDLSTDHMIIYEYNPINEMLVERLNLVFLYDELDKLMFLFYFTFLIDIDPNNYNINEI